MAAEQVTYNAPDGATMGKSATEKISFFGVTTVVQPAATAQSAITAGASTTSTIALLIEIRTALVNLGLIKGGAA